MPLLPNKPEERELARQKILGALSPSKAFRAATRAASSLLGNAVFYTSILGGASSGLLFIAVAALFVGNAVASLLAAPGETVQLRRVAVPADVPPFWIEAISDSAPKALSILSDAAAAGRPHVHIRAKRLEEAAIALRGDTRGNHVDAQRRKSLIDAFDASEPMALSPAEYASAAATCILKPSKLQSTETGWAISDTSCVYSGGALLAAVFSGFALLISVIAALIHLSAWIERFAFSIRCEAANRREELLAAAEARTLNKSIPNPTSGGDGTHSI